VRLEGTSFIPCTISIESGSNENADRRAPGRRYRWYTIVDRRPEGHYNELYKSVVLKSATSQEVESSDCVQRLKTLLNDFVSIKLSMRSRTSKLWLMYVRYIDVLKALIRSDRTGNWQMHLTSIAGMLNLFAATGHTNYAKCGRLYVEMMLDLPQTNQFLHEMFNENGCHVVRRSRHVWAGISTDLAIEQVMMRSIKRIGGLTHGRGMTESTRLTWVHSVHMSGMVHASLTALCQLERKAEQHIESGNARCNRDYQDLQKLITWFESNNPFNGCNSHLCSLSSGVVAADSDNITCDDAESVGEAVMKSMDGLPFTDVKIKKQSQIRTLAQVNSTATVQRKFELDSGLLFGRLLLIMQRQPEMSSYFQYELTATPASLFKDNFMRKPDKAILKHELLVGIDTSNFP
jgi:hypothetical protein